MRVCLAADRAGHGAEVGSQRDVRGGGAHPPAIPMAALSRGRSPCLFRKAGAAVGCALGSSRARAQVQCLVTRGSDAPADGRRAAQGLQIAHVGQVRAAYAAEPHRRRARQPTPTHDAHGPRPRPRPCLAAQTMRSAAPAHWAVRSTSPNRMRPCTSAASRRSSRSARCRCRRRRPCARSSSSARCLPPVRGALGSVGYHAAWDTVLRGISCCVGYHNMHAAWDDHDHAIFVQQQQFMLCGTMLCGIP